MRMFGFVCLKHNSHVALWVLYQTGSRWRESIGVHNTIFYKQKRQGYTEGDRCRSSPPPGQIKVCSESHAFPRAISRPQMLLRDRELCHKWYKYSADSLEYPREFRKIFYHLASHLGNVIIFFLDPLRRVSIVIHMHHNSRGSFIFAQYVGKWALICPLNIF